MARNARQNRRLSATYEQVAGIPRFDSSGIAPEGALGSIDPRNDDAPHAVGTKLGGNGVFQKNGR